MQNKAKPRLNKPVNIALSMLGILMLLVQTIVNVTISTSETTIDRLWRGSYDILVTHQDFSEAVNIGTNEYGLNLVEPNYAGVAAPTISAEQLAQIRQTAGVEVAAPIGYIGTQNNNQKWPLVFIPYDIITANPTLELQLQFIELSDDGVSQRVNHSSQLKIIIDSQGWNQTKPSDATPLRAAEHGIKTINLQDPTVQHSAMLHQNGLTVLTSLMPIANTTVVAVDPQAEQQLLPPELAAEMQKLQDAENILAAQPAATAAAFLAALETDTDWAQQLLALTGDETRLPSALYGGLGMENPLVPYLRNTASYPPLSFKTVITQVTPQGEHTVGEITVDLGEQMRPFGDFGFVVPWPGVVADVDPAFALSYGGYYSAMKVGPLQLRQDDSADGHTVFKVQTFGFAAPVGTNFSPEYVPEGKLPGEIRTYRDATETEISIGAFDKQGAAHFEVGTYQPQTFDGKKAGYVPLGLYEHNPLRTQETKTELHPDLHGLGLVAQSPNVIVPLSAAAHFTQDEVVNAVRVRVGGISELPREQAQLEIDRVATQLRALGLNAVIVSGASKQTVPMYVPGYAYGVTDPNGAQEIADLGWVAQDLTVTGTDVWTAQTFKTVSLNVGKMLLALMLGGVFLVALLVRPQSVRGQQLLALLGWSKTMRLRWAVSEVAVGITVLSLSGCAAILISTPDNRLFTAVCMAAAVLALGIMFSAMRGKTRPASVIGSRGTLVFLAAVCAASAAAVAILLAQVAQVLQWLSEVSQKFTLSQAVLETLLPAGAMTLLVVIFFLYLLFLAVRIRFGLQRERTRFKYEVLAQSSSKLSGAALFAVALEALLACGLIGLVMWLGSAWLQLQPLGLVILLGTVLIWCLILTVASLQMLRQATSR